MPAIICAHDWKPDRDPLNFTCSKCGADKLRWAEARIVILERVAHEVRRYLDGDGSPRAVRDALLALEYT